MRVRKATLNPFLILAFFICSFFNNQAIAASKCWEVTPQNINETLASIKTMYSSRVLVPDLAITDFLDGQLSQLSIDNSLAAPSPYSTSILTEQIRFRWQPVLNQEESYITAALHLQLPNTQWNLPTSRVAGADFPFTPQQARELWLYSFHTINGDEQSILTIIIIDKDISFSCDSGKGLKKETTDSDQNTSWKKPSPIVSPNPFDEQVNIQFELPEEGMVSLQLYDLTGRLVKTPIAQSLLSKGEHQLNFDWTDLPAGSYFYHLNWEGRNSSNMIVKTRK